MKKILFLMVSLGLVLGSGRLGTADMAEVKKEYYSNGSIKSEKNFKDGQLSGQSTTYYQNGKKESEIAYENGIPVGRGIFYFEDGNLKEEIAYLNGFDNMKIRSYYLNRNLHMASHKEGIRLVEVQEYAPNGQILKEIHFDQNGEVKEEKNFDTDGNFLKDGILMQYHPNGKASMETPYRDAKAEGLRKQYDETGRTVAEIVYQGGKEVSRKDYDKK